MSLADRQFRSRNQHETQAVERADHFNQVQKSTMMVGCGEVFSPGTVSDKRLAVRRGVSPKAQVPGLTENRVSACCSDFDVLRAIANVEIRKAQRQPLPGA